MLILKTIKINKKFDYFSKKIEIDSMKYSICEKNDQKISRTNVAIIKNRRKFKNVNEKIKLTLKKNKIFIISKKEFAVLQWLVSL